MVGSGEALTAGGAVARKEDNGFLIRGAAAILACSSSTALEDPDAPENKTD